MKMSALMSAAALAAGACAPAAAEVVTYDFTAVIYQIEEVNTRFGFGVVVPSSELPGETVTLGQTISGRFSYSTDTQRWTSSREGGRLFSWYTGPLLSAGIDGTGVGYRNDDPARGGAALVDSAAGQGVDTLGLYSDGPWGTPQHGMHIKFTDPSGQAIGSAALGGLADLSVFPEAHLTYRVDQGMLAMLADAKLTSLTRVSPVPEPSVPLLWLTAGGMLALLRRRAVKGAA